MKSAIHEAIRQRLAQAQRALILTHVRPDGDAIGSMLGLGLALIEAGKEVHMVLPDGMLSAFKHLPGSDLVRRQPEGSYDTFITVDCAEKKRIGNGFDSLGQPHINLDHHKTNDHFAEINLVEADQVATCAILAEYLPRWGLRITPPVAANLLTGIITDTLGFRTSNMTPKALRLSADLMETGIDLSDLYMRGLVRRSFSAMRYWGAGLSSLQRANGMVWTALTLSDRKNAGYSGNDDADLINVISAVDGEQVALIFVEQPADNVKISWRALAPGVDVSRVAQSFGGGGHAAAAGAEVAGGLEEVQQRVLQATQAYLALTKNS